MHSPTSTLKQKKKYQLNKEFCWNIYFVSCWEYCNWFRHLGLNMVYLLFQTWFSFSYWLSQVPFLFQYHSSRVLCVKLCSYSQKTWTSFSNQKSEIYFCLTLSRGARLFSCRANKPVAPRPSLRLCSLWIFFFSPTLNRGHSSSAAVGCTCGDRTQPVAISNQWGVYIMRL